MLIKLGEASEISLEPLDSCTPLVNQDMLDKFQKTANALKRVAPKASDFLYFTATMLHAAEASAVNDDGTPRLNAKGEEVKVGWDKTGGTWRWQTNDPKVKPYKNSNGDIFPEEELVKAYKKWQYKPLCIDHKSSSVDHVRGFIVDTYYDRKLKRVIGLCALDKAGFPQLARQVETGVSNCVSMGTAVGRAICTDCATVAKTEADFCDHMRRKTCYGEINVDLNPIELSIVVNGADPKANIKHIFAAANAMSAYLEEKDKELSKIANTYTASIEFMSDKSKDLASKVTNMQIKSDDLDSFKKDINSAIEDFEKLQNDLKNTEEDNNSANDQVSNDEATDSELSLSPPQQRYANTDLSKLHLVIYSINEQIKQMSEKLSKLDKTANKQEENMSGVKEINKNAYMQGTEEPASPGQKKYPVDPLNQKLRDNEDRHMQVDGDMGPVDGMFPGDLDRKKMLARAELEERSLKRAAIVDLAKEALEKKSYFQNGEGPNNPNSPTPGKQKYPVDKLNEQLRNVDKHMVGKKPFPNVGPVDGTYPGDLEVKKKLSRAEGVINASFIKAKNNDGTVNLGKSSWQVFNGDKLLLTASVSDLTGGRSDLVSYNSVANAEFGKKVIENIKSFGADGFKQIMKQAQEMAPPPPPPPQPAPQAPQAEGPAEDKMVEDSGNAGDPKEVALELSEKVKTLSSDLHEAVRELAGEQVEMNDSEMSATASFNKSRKELNSLLSTAMTEAVQELDGHSQELEMIVNLYDKDLGASNVPASLVNDAIMEAQASVNGGFELMKAFICYADGTEAMLKKAEIISELNALASDEKEEDVMDYQHDDDLMSLLEETDSELDEVKEMHDSEEDDHDHGHDHDSDLEDDLEGELSDLSDEDSESLSDEMDMLEAEDVDDANATVKQEELKDVKLPPNSTVTVVAGFDSKDSRAALRAKLAADSLKVSPLLHDAHPKGGFTLDLDVKPTGDLAKVETLEEVHDKMMDIATAPVKVRKEAEAIDQLVKAGSLDPADLDALISEGLDKDAVAYWKKYYANVDGGSEFASELVKEHVKAEMQAELDLYKVKVARAYELVYDMVERGLCPNTASAKAEQVDAVMKCNDESFETLKKVVAKHSTVMEKKAGFMPNVGINSDDYSGSKKYNEFESLSEMLATSKRKGSF